MTRNDRHFVVGNACGAICGALAAALLACAVQPINKDDDCRVSERGASGEPHQYAVVSSLLGKGSSDEHSNREAQEFSTEQQYSKNAPINDVIELARVFGGDEIDQSGEGENRASSDSNSSFFKHSESPFRLALAQGGL